MSDIQFSMPNFILAHVGTWIDLKVVKFEIMINYKKEIKNMIKN